MDFYDVKWKRSAQKELKSLDRQVIPKILAAVEALANNAYPPGAKKLAGSEHTYRIRLGDYRIIYDVITSALAIEIFEYVTAKRLICSSVAIRDIHEKVSYSFYR